MATKTARKPKPCTCGCGEQTGGGDFRPGHDARYKSALVKRGREGDAEAVAILESRGWERFLVKKGKTVTRTSSGDPENETDGLPKNAWRPADHDQAAFIERICSGRQVVVRRTVGNTDIVMEELLRFRDPFHLVVRNDSGKGWHREPNPHPRQPLQDGILEVTCDDTGGRRSIRLTDVVGVMNK